MNLDLMMLSKYRRQLMGLAMLLIILFHMSINVSDINFLRSLKDIGDVGVDMFFLLSGMGLYFSYYKNNNKHDFYLKRILRILPTFIPVVFVWYCALALLFDGTIEYILLGVSTLGFWITGDLTEWFIAAILVLYLITPFYLDFMQTEPKRVTFIACLFFILLGLSIRFTPLNHYGGHLLIFICRIPIFLIGLYVGSYIFNKDIISLNSKFIFSITLISLIFCLFVVNPQYLYITFILKYFAYIPLAFGICVITSNIFDKIGNKDKTLYLLIFLGIYSLEMYLFHEKILYILSFTEKFILIDKYHIVINLVALVSAMIISYIWNKIVNKLLKYNSGLSTLN